MDLSSYFEKFTKEAKQALAYAQEKAKESKTNYVGTEHVLLGILSQGNSLGATILRNFGVSIDNVNLVLKTVGRSTTAQKAAAQAGGLSGYAKKVITDAVKCAHEYNHMFVGTEHLLYALVMQENTAATVILENMKIDTNDVKRDIVKAFEKTREGGSRPEQMAQQAAQQGMNPLEFFLSGLHGVLVGQEKTPEYKEAHKHKDSPAHESQGQQKTPALDYFTTDLTKECRDGKLDPVIGREHEIERVISILLRKTKNNPVIIGEPGVGKTAIVEGLAHAIVKENVPDALLDKRILSLSMTAVVAGTKYRGEFEERIKQIIDEAAACDNVILFIDELHTVIGAGSAEGSLDAANILKPALSRGRIQIIGATTIKEYRKHVESDAALERRFQPVMADEPSEEQTLEILKGLREAFENHHNLIITDESLVAAAKMSKRYVTDRFHPDKAIDLLDEAASLKGIKAPSNQQATKKLLKALNKIVKKKEEAVSNQDYEYAAELRSKELELMTEIEKSRTMKIPRAKREKVTADDIALVVSRMTGIPVNKLVSTDVARLMHLEDTLHTRVVGQEEAIQAVARAIRRSRAGIADAKRPTASFLFLGPTGVGKTELVRAIAAEVYNDDQALIKIDMSEFMERHNTSRLIGATPGYIGYEEGGQLTEAVRKKPYAVILFDEIEKAHSEVFNLLLQILEDGQLTDGKGRRVDFRNTIIVMTSNIGSELLTKQGAAMGFDISADEREKVEQEYDVMKEKVLNELRDHMRPEFLNRIDKVIVFHPLTHAEVKQIVKLHVAMLQERLSDKKLTLDLTPNGLEHLAQASYDPEYGARPVRRKIQDLIEDPLTHGLLEGRFHDGDTITIMKKKNGIELVRAVANKPVRKRKEKATEPVTAGA